MKIGTRGLYLLLPASLAALMGCATPDIGPGEESETTPDDATEEVTEATEALGCQAVGGALDCNNWAAWSPIDGVSGCGVPVTSACGEDICMVYQGCGGGNDLYWSTYRGGAWSAGVAIDGVSACGQPALSSCGEEVCMVYEACGSGDLYMARYGAARFGGWRWGAPELIPGIRSTFAPGLAYYNNNLHLFYGGANRGLYMASYNRGVWGAGIGIAGVRTGVAPGVAVYGGRLHLAYADGFRNQLYTTAWDGYGWGARTLIPGAYSAYRPTLGVFNNALNLFYPTLRGDGYGWNAWAGRGWAGNVLIPGGIYGNPYAHFGLYGRRAALYTGYNQGLYWSGYR